MSWHAVDAVDDAVEATRRFLFPFSLVRWTKLAVLVLLMGGGVSANASFPVVPDADGTALEALTGVSNGPLDGFEAIDAELVAGLSEGGLFAAVVGAVLIVVVLSVVSLSLRLVFYDALHTNEIRLWRPFVSRLRQAIGLFAVSTVIWAAAATPVVLVVLVATASASPIGWAPLDTLFTALGTLSTGPSLAFGLVGAVFTLLGLLALRLTYEFIVPTMIVEDCGVIAAWKRAWAPLRGSLADVAVYLVVHFVIAVGLSILEGITAALIGGAVVVAAGVVLLIIAGALGGLGSLIGTTAGIASIALVGAVALLALLVLFSPVRVVTRSYLISYEVSTLGGIDPSLAMLDPDIDPSAATPHSTDS